MVHSCMFLSQDCGFCIEDLLASIVIHPIQDQDLHSSWPLHVSFHIYTPRHLPRYLHYIISCSCFNFFISSFCLITYKGFDLGKPLFTNLINKFFLLLIVCMQIYKLRIKWKTNLKQNCQSCQVTKLTFIVQEYRIEATKILQVFRS